MCQRHLASISTSSQHALLYIRPVTRDFHAPRHPIILCHGLFGYDRMGPETIPPLQIHYWRGISEGLVQLGATVYAARVSKTGIVKTRAEELHQQLSTRFSDQSVNLIAHSMGGLDGRYLITHVQGKPYVIKSLTTVCTPHRGSAFMDWCRDHLGLGKHEPLPFTPPTTNVDMEADTIPLTENAEISQLTPLIEKTIARLKPILPRVMPVLDVPAYSNLTTTFCKQTFNPMTPNDPNVLYQSYAARLANPPLIHPLRIPWEVIKETEGPNDGLVSITSAKWGDFLGIVDNVDHWEMNNRFRWTVGESRNRFNAVEFYIHAATTLYHKGC
jgi:hypothetical protein